MEEIKKFRENPKSFLDKKDSIKNKKKRTDYETFINSLDSMNELKLNKELCETAKEELKILADDENYEHIQIGESVRNEIKEKLSDEEIALIALEDINENEIEDIIKKIITNDLDKDKLGRQILTDLKYTHIGFSISEEDSIVLIFVKKEPKEKEIKEDEIEEKEEPIELTEEEKSIIEQIKIFRENPKSFLDKKESIKNKKKRNDYEAFINSLDSMNELKLNKDLCEIAKKEIAILMDDENYEHIQIGESVRNEIKEKLLDKEIALIAIEDIEEIEDIIFKKIITNDSDKKKLGRKILTDISFTHLGISQFISSEENDDKPIIIIFSKNKEKDTIEEKINESLQSLKEDQNKQEYNDLSDIKKEIINLDNNDPNEMNGETKNENKIENNSSSGTNIEGPKDSIKKEKTIEVQQNDSLNENKEAEQNEQADINIIKEEHGKRKEKKENEEKDEIINESENQNNKNKDKKEKPKEKTKSKVIDPLTSMNFQTAKKKIFFFTSLDIYNVNGIEIVKVVKDKKEKPLDTKFFEYSVEDYRLNNILYKIIYFKLNIEEINSFKIRVYYLTNNYFTSDVIRIQKDTYILDHIKLFRYNKPANQINFNNQSILYYNLQLLDIFNAETLYTKCAIQKYIPDSYITLNELLLIMKYYADYECIPLFLKNININNILNQNSYYIHFDLINNNYMFNKLGDLIIDKKFKCDSRNEDKKICYLFLLDFYAWIYYKFSQTKFSNLFNSEDALFRASLSRLVAKKIIKIKDLQEKFNIDREKIIPFIIENSSSFDEIANIFLTFNNIVDALNVINMYYEEIINKLNQNEESNIFSKIMNYLSSGKKEISLPEPSERDDIDSIFNLQKSILEKDKDNRLKNKIIINFESISYKLIEGNRKAGNYQKLIKLKPIINNLIENGKEIKSLINNFYEAIHDTGISLALQGRFSNKEIIDFIKNDIYYTSNKYWQSSKRDPNVFLHFDILDENGEGIKDFIELKLYEKFENKKKILYKIFIGKLRDFDNLNILFKLFPKENLDNEFIELLIYKLKVLYFLNYNGEEESVDNLGENMYILFLNMARNRTNVNNLTKLIEEKLDSKTIKEVYIKVLSKNNEKVTQYVNEEIAKYFTNNLHDLNADGIYFLIKSCANNKQFLSIIFNKIDNYAIEEKDFYSLNISQNFELYKLFVENGYINDVTYLDTNYFRKIGKLNNKIFFDIKDLKVSFLKISDLLEKNKDGFLSKLKLVFINENASPDQLYFQIVDNFKKCKEKISQLNKIHDYLILFERKSSRNLIDNLQNIINNLRQRQIKEILSEKETENIPNYKDLIKRAENLKYKESIFLMKFYEELKKEKGFNYDEIQLLNEALNIYNNSIKKIINYKKHNFMNIEKINFILDVVKNKKKEVDKEMEFISNEFNDYIANCNVNIELIKKNLLNFANLKILQNYLHGYVFILQIFQEISKKPNYLKTTFSTNLEGILAELSINDVKSESVEKAYKILSEYGINVYKKNEDDFNEFILKLIGKTNEIKFCIGKTDEEIKNLNEFLQDRQSESGNLQPDDFNDFIGCKKYVNEVIQSEFSNDKQLDIILKQKFREDKFLLVKFNNYLEKYGEIKELYEDSISNKSEITKTLIQKIMKDSAVTMKKTGNKFSFEGKYENVEKKKEEIFDLKLLLQLKNKALFSQNTVKEDEIYKEQITNFNDIVLKIYNLSKTVENLILAGYPHDISINLKIKDNYLINVDNKNKTAKEMIKEYESLFDEFDKEITKSYKNKPYLRFFYGPLFMSILQKIKDNDYPIEFLLKAISNGKIKTLPKQENIQISEDADFSEIFSIINRYLDFCFLENKINMERILEKNKVSVKKEGLYRVAIFSDLEKNLLLLYKQLTGNFPLSNTVLFCNEYTSNEEIKAFLYLGFRSDYPALFCLLGIEKLDSEKRVKTIKSINRFNKKYGKETRGCIVIIYLKNSEIGKPLTKIIPDSREILLNEEKEELKFESNNIEIYTSIRAGFGKTEEIRNKIIQEKKNYKYFPLGGDFTREEVVERLINLKLPQNDNGNYAIHFDLSETNLTELVQEILFKILILKKLDINEKIFYFGDELKVKIELPNGFYNYMDKFPILKLFKSNIFLKELLPLKLAPNIQKINDSDIQIVANTLDIYKQKKIGNQNLNFKSTKLLSNNQCQSLIDEFLKNNENNYNYYQKISFIKLLSVQFRMFKDCLILNPSSFVNVHQKKAIIKSREQIIKSILDSTLYFSKGPYDNLIKSQMTSQESDDVFDEEKSNQRALKSLEITKDNISFDNIPGTLFFFNGDLSTFTAITKSEKGTDEYKRFYDLINIHSTSGGQKTDLPDYSKGDHFFYLNELKKILGLPEMLFDENEIKDLNQQIKEETKEELDANIYSQNISEDRKLYMAKLAKKNGNYIYTKDNFIKSVIILQRIQASIPVILMGETGCGKTSLLKMLSIFMNKGYEKMKTLNVHAGTNEEDIINFMRNKVINKIEKEKEEDLKKIMDKFDSQDEKYKKSYKRDNYLNEQKKILDEKKIWVFFDELNTCNSMGLITEMMCKRTMHGEKLPDELIFLGAVNPYRTMTSRMKHSGLTYHSDSGDKTSNLVYTVNPLPHTLMNYIFNFSNLKEKEEKEYINSMILQNFTKFYPDKANKDYKAIVEKTLGSICDCHNFIRKQYDESSVSLREIRRFNIFYKFFLDYLKNKSIYKEHYKNTLDLLEGALNITLYLCYYLRISDKKIREELARILDKYFHGKSFEEIPLREVTYISEQFIIDYEKGIALNRSLKENLFTSFVCIVNRIPLIIVGKPGEGKSLTIQTINQTMKGAYSQSPLFKEYPQLFMYNYQGSETSTSQGIIETFEKARAYARNQLEKISKEEGEKKEKFIAMIFFDEMGLAERSPNNPLKAIHSQLEYDDNEFKIAFVGISNWKIDASKMNRCLTLSKPDPDKEDLLLTADTIANALDNTLANNYKTLIEALAITYYEYKQSTNKNKLIANFHGNRDFYNLIKCAMRELIKEKDNINELNKEKILTKIGLMSLTRNFGGLDTSLKDIKNKFKEVYTNYNEDETYSYNILECIKDNLNDYNSRFLMLVANSTIIKYLENVLDSQGKDYIFLTGSQFQQDKKAAEKGGGYSEDLLNKIQYQMSKDSVLILKNLEVIYPSLYELFNQNYKIIGNKYFSKIAFASSKSSSEVHRNFRVILLITQQQLDKMKVDPPLLNRFEKQIVSFKDSLNEKQIELAENLIKSFDIIKTFNGMENKLVYNLPELMINCNIDEIEGLIYKICNKYKDKKDDNGFIENEIFKIIVPTFCQDIIASVKYSGFDMGNNAERARKILDIYKQREINNFSQLLDKMKKDKNVIYTFSNMYDIFIPEEINNKFKELIVENINSENTVQDEMSKFYEEKTQYLLFRFVERDLNKMNHLSYLVNNFETKYKQQTDEETNNTSNDEENTINTKTNSSKKKTKKIIFLIHLTRKNIEHNKNSGKNKKIKTSFFTEELISNLDDSYDKYFIDNLRSERNDFINILNIKSPTELVSSIIDFDKFLDKNLNTIISYFDYNFMNKFDKKTLKDYTNTILSKLILKKGNEDVKFLRRLIINTILNNLNQTNMIPKVYTSKVFQNTDVDFFQVLETYMNSELSNKLLMTVNIFEKRGLFSCFLVNQQNRNVIGNQILLNQIKTELENIDITLTTKPLAQLRGNKIDLITNLSIPSIYLWLNKIKVDFINAEKIGIKYINNENSLRPKQKLKNEIKKIEAYSNTYKNFLNGMKEQIYKNNNLREIFQLDNTEEIKNIKKALYTDYLLICCLEISDKFSNKDENFMNPIKFIEVLLQLRFNIINNNFNYQENDIEFSESYFDINEDFNIDNYSEVFLYLECYKNEIIILSEIFCLLMSYLPNTFSKMKEIIQSKIIKTESSERNPSYKKLVNEVFYILMESLLKSIYNNNEQIYNLEIYDFYRFFDSLKFIEASFNKINQKFLLFSNELYSLRNLLSVYNLFKDEQDIKDVIKQVINIIGKDNEYLQNNNFVDLKDNIMKIKKIISDRYGENSEQLADYMSNFLRQQYRKIDNKDYQFELLNLAFENDKLIQKSLFFIGNTINIPYPVLYNKKESEKKIVPKNWFEKKEKCAEYFLNFINSKNSDRIYLFYENINNETFNQVLLYYFELLAYNYFDDILNKYKDNRPDPNNLNIKSKDECEELLLEQNLLYLNKALIHIDKCFTKEGLEERNLNNLGNIFSISYIKLYIKYLAEIYKNNKTKINFTNIIECISSTECQTRKIVKYFFFKNMYQYFENFSKFDEYIKKDKEFPFRKEYLEMIQSQRAKVYILNNNFIQMKNFELFYNTRLEFLSNFHNNFININSLLKKEFLQNNDGLDIFFCFCMNNLFSYYYSNEKEIYLNKINLLKIEFNKIANNLELSQVCLNLLKQIFNLDQFIQTLNLKQGNANKNLTQEQFEIFMYALRFVLNSSQYNANNFYYKLLNPQCKEHINNNYIIGTLPFNNIFLKSYYSLNVLLRSPTPTPTGYYVCTCGQYYTLGNCTCPSIIFDCYNKNCKLKISGTHHKLLGPEAGQTDHWRVILEEKDKKLNQYVEREIKSGKIPCIFLDEYKRRYVDKFINQQPKGIKKEEAEDFLERKDSVRTLDEFSFRFLNFILYSHLFFSNILGNIRDDDLKLYTHGDFTCFRMIEKTWEMMENILNEKGINNIKSFMNIICNKLGDMMGEIEDVSTIEKRQNFETGIRNYFEEIFKNKDLYYKMESDYNNYNERMKDNDPHSLIEIISENYSPFEGLYTKEVYPNMEMLLISKYPSMNELERYLEIQPDYTKNFCLLNQVFISNEEYALIENIGNINKLVDYLYKKYNNRIERDKAKVIKLKDCFENENFEEIKENLLEPYIDSWNKIKSKCTKYLCRPDMPELTITIDHSLIHFLPDDGELYGGMYLASCYKNAIDWQNSFVDIVTSSIGPHSVLKSYLSQLNQEIYIQDATDEDLVKINNKTYNRVKDMIKQYSMRNIFKNGKIDFKEFKSIKYDLESIESELGRIILPGVKRFVFSEQNDEPIKFVVFLYETFRSSRSSIISNYNQKYPSRELTEEEKKLLYFFIKKNKNLNQNFSKDILSSCSILIDFIQKENYNKNKPISKVIGKLPEYILLNFNELLKSFFIENSEEEINENSDFVMFSINTLIEIYNLIELICWNQFKENLNIQYQMHLKDDIKKAIKEYLDNAITENNIIKKQDIANAVRRLISRYLSGKRGDSDISEYRPLSEQITRADLWRAELTDNDNFNNEIYGIFEGIKEVTTVVIECNEETNKCETCSEMIMQGIENPCKICNNCKWGLRIGHALEFYELINEEVFNENKYNDKEREDNSDDEDREGIKKNLMKTKTEEKIFEINTTSKIENEGDNEYENEDKIEDINEEEKEEQKEETVEQEDGEDEYGLDEDDNQEI